MSSSLLLQQCPACLARLTCIVFVMGPGTRFFFRNTPRVSHVLGGVTTINVAVAAAAVAL